VRHGLGVVFDGGRLIHDLTVAENVALPMRYHENLKIEDALTRVQTLLDLVGVAHFGTSYPAAIGRNWQQRAGLARALALNPEVLLLDNALTGLDPRDAHWWLEFLNALWTGQTGGDRKPMTLIATADDLRSWRDRASRFALLKEKQFIVLGDQKELVQHREPFLKELLPAPSRAS
jgi:ABC-type transporter Mla maintaining outer membrane lipid asymmetry ATPase subunit MlaF